MAASDPAGLASSRPALVRAGLVLAAVFIVLGLVHYALTGDTANPYAANHVLVGVVATAVGAWTAKRRPDHPLGQVLLWSGVASSVAFVSQPAIVQAMWNDAPEPVIRSLVVLTSGWMLARAGLFVIAPSVVPDGWPRGLRRWLLGLGAAAGIVMVIASQLTWLGEPLGGGGGGDRSAVFAATARVADLATGAMWFISVLAIGGMLVAIARRGTEMRRRTRWFAAASVLLAVPGTIVAVLTVLPALPIAQWFFDRVELLGGVLLPLALVAGVLHDRMLDIEVVVRRGLVYLLLTIGSAAVYAAAVGVAWIAWGGGGLAPVVGTGAVALAFQPLRGMTQRWVTRHVYGHAEEPYRVLTELGQRLSDAPSAQQALPALATGVADVLRIPYVGVELDLERTGVPWVAAEAGTPTDDCLQLDLVYGGRRIGRLLVARRTAGEEFRPEELALLRDLARHAGAVAHNALVTADLVRSRMDLVVAREEERRRLRGDLHDGLGPTLASVALGLEAATGRLEHDAELSALLGDLNTGLHEAMEDIRRVVYGLRPPALDELGLVRAISSFVEALGGRECTPVVTLRSMDLPDLPAAVEVAAYRITLEAVTNVRRHAGARTCDISLTTESGELVVEVRDDGVGLNGSAAGVGLVSMRQRAEDLGGRLHLCDRSTGGTVLTAHLPLSYADAPVDA